MPDDDRIEQDKTRESEKQRWIYAGRRQMRKGTLSYCWIDESDEERFYSKLKAGVVGGSYEVEIDDGGAVFLNPAYLEPSGDSRTAQWDLLDRSAYANDERRKRETKDKRDASGFGTMTIDQFRSAYLAAPSMQRPGMLAQLLREVGAA